MPTSSTSRTRASSAALRRSLLEASAISIESRSLAARLLSFLTLALSPAGSAIASDRVTLGPSGTALAMSLASATESPLTRHTSRTSPRALRLWKVAICPTRALP